MNYLKHIVLLILLFSNTLISRSQNNLSEGKLWLTIQGIGIQEQEDLGTVFQSEQFQTLRNKYAINSFEKAFPDSRKTALKSVYEVTCHCDASELAEEMKKNNSFSEIVPAPSYELLSNDPNDYLLEFSQDYALDLIRAKQAWSYTTGDTNIVLGVSDGAYFENQEDLSSEIVSIVNSPNASMNYRYHGTAVATTVAGATNNNQGKSSIGYNCRLALNTIGYNQLLALSYAGARVVNLSWSSGCSYNSYAQQVIDEVNENGTIIVAAAGNGSTCGGPTSLVYPASFDGVISVSSIGPQDNHEKIPGDVTSTHQHNSTVDICAPGYDVPVAMAPGGYVTTNGTSMAAPYVTGTIGLMLSINPCLDYERVLMGLQQTAHNIDEQNPMYVGMLGAGRLNAENALEYAFRTTCNPPNNYSTLVEIDPIDPKEEQNILSTFEEEIAKMNIKVYPNPTRDWVQVEWQNGYFEEIHVIDFHGRLIKSKKIDQGDIKTNIQLDESGLYFIRLMKNGRAILTQKVSKF